MAKGPVSVERVRGELLSRPHTAPARARRPAGRGGEERRPRLITTVTGRVHGRVHAEARRQGVTASDLLRQWIERGLEAA